MRQPILGLIVNPVAGLGGRVGLKGSDGAGIQQHALSLGAKPEAPGRAITALEHLLPQRGSLTIMTCPGAMGEEAARACGFEPTIIDGIRRDATTAADTRRAAQTLRGEGASLILFAGGDGTARDIYDALGAAAPVLGIPAGVKIHSGVYAINPASAGRLAGLYLQGTITGLREAEVMDLDEDAFRQGIVAPRLHGYLSIPFEPRYVQARKSPSTLAESGALDAIALDVIEHMQPGVLYIVGPGTTTRPILAHLGLPKTLIGVDAVVDRQLAAADVTQARLLDLVAERPARIVVTPIGGQGYIFGRGNQQIGPQVIGMVGKDNILVVATTEKMLSLEGRPLLVDTGDAGIDNLLAGYIRVITGFGERLVYKVSAGES